MNQIFNFIKKNIFYVTLVLLVLIMASSFIGLFIKDINDDRKLMKLEYDYALSQKELAKQIRISDSLILKSNVSMYFVVHDTVQLPRIKEKYEKQKLDNRELTPDEQLRFSAKWLSEADSTK